LNRYPRLRNVLHNQLKSFENLEVEFVHGVVPTAYFYAADGSEIGKAELGDRSLEELFELFSTHGFTPVRAAIVYPSEPTATASFGGHHYELYSTPNYVSSANDLARSRSHNGLQGYTLTVTSPEENAFVLDFLSSNGVQKVWLGARDTDEGEWKWIGGPESGSVFWNGNQQGSAVDKNYVNWREGEPNDVDDEDCGLFYGFDGKWNDGACSTETASLVIEYGDAPLSIPPSEKTDL